MSFGHVSHIRKHRPTKSKEMPIKKKSRPQIPLSRCSFFFLHTFITSRISTSLTLFLRHENLSEHARLFIPVEFGVSSQLAKIPQRALLSCAACRCLESHCGSKDRCPDNGTSYYSQPKCAHLDYEGTQSLSVVYICVISMMLINKGLE